MEIILEPVMASNEVLRTDVKGVRPRVSLNKHATSVVLGKNASTGIADSTLKRKMARIQLLDRFVRLEALDELSKLSINGTTMKSPGTKLGNNDVISLIASSCAYSYKVIIKNPLPPPSNSRSPSKRKARPTSMVDLTEELSCPVCLDLYVEATALVGTIQFPRKVVPYSHNWIMFQVPCGHTLCHSCLPKLLTSECMSCRAPIQQTIPSHITDSIVSQLAAAGNFSGDEITNYRLRSGLR